MHHGPEMSSVRLLMQPSSITPTLTPGGDDEEEEEEEDEEEWRIGKEKQGEEGGENTRERGCTYKSE